MKYAQAQPMKRLKTAIRLADSGKAVALSMFFILLATAIIPALGTFACLLAILMCSLIFGALFKPRINICTEVQHIARPLHSRKHSTDCRAIYTRQHFEDEP